MSGVTVAQLMNNLPFARLSNPPLKIFFIALSSVTTVMMTSESLRDLAQIIGGGCAQFLGQRLCGGRVDVTQRRDFKAAFLQAASHVRAHAADADEANFL